MAYRTLNRTNKRTLARAGLALALSFTSISALAITGEEVSRGLGKESEVTVHLRSYYLERDKPAPSSDLGAWALGGWLGYQSGWIADFLRVGAVGYTSQPLWAPDDKDGTLLLKPGQLFAIAAFVGCLCFVLLSYKYGVDTEHAAWIAILLTLLIRVLAVRFNWTTRAFGWWRARGDGDSDKRER